MKRIIKKIFLFSLVVSMLIGTSSVNIYANNISLSSEDIKIELVQDGKTVETGYNLSLIHIYIIEILEEI